MDFEISFLCSESALDKGARERKKNNIVERIVKEGEERKNLAFLISEVYQSRRKSVWTPSVLLCLIDRASIIDLPYLLHTFDPDTCCLPLPWFLKESIRIIQRELLTFEWTSGKIIRFFDFKHWYAELKNKINFYEYWSIIFS